MPIIRVYVVAAIAFIAVGAIFRGRREPERKWLIVALAVSMSIAVLVGAWIANGMAL